MKAMLLELRRAACATLALAIVCCGLYPLVVFGVAQLLFPDQANGSLIVDADGVRGSRLIGQVLGDGVAQLLRGRAEVAAARTGRVVAVAGG
jgi:K+-transporting ATPase c subunit